jgi:hypothetical protein
MTDIVIIRHARETTDFPKYSVSILAEVWREAGHRVTVVCGIDDLPQADLAFLHVDLSVVPQTYTAVAQRFPRVVNGRARDIRKQTVSRHLVRRDSGWPGPVIAKSDLNCGGIPEWRMMRQHGRPGEAALSPQGYRLFRSTEQVPEEVWEDPNLVVERYLPEQDERGWHIRTWTFLGDRGRCRRSRGRTPFVRSGTIIDSEPDEIPVPDLLHAERERLGFDYGKFDFVMHEGEAILLDANKTFGVIPSPGNRLYHYLGEALDGLLA